MNTRQIVIKYEGLEKEIKELKTSLNLIEDEVGRGRVYSMLLKELEEKQKEFNMFSKVDWVSE